MWQYRPTELYHADHKYVAREKRGNKYRYFYSVAEWQAFKQRAQRGIHNIADGAQKIVANTRRDIQLRGAKRNVKNIAGAVQRQLKNPFDISSHARLEAKRDRKIFDRNARSLSRKPAGELLKRAGEHAKDSLDKAREHDRQYNQAKREIFSKDREKQHAKEVERNARRDARQQNADALKRQVSENAKKNIGDAKKVAQKVEKETGRAAKKVDKAIQKYRKAATKETKKYAKKAEKHIKKYLKDTKKSWNEMREHDKQYNDAKKAIMQIDKNKQHNATAEKIWNYEGRSMVNAGKKKIAKGNYKEGAKLVARGKTTQAAGSALKKTADVTGRAYQDLIVKTNGRVISSRKKKRR